jgi:hypothetical protein
VPVVAVDPPPRVAGLMDPVPLDGTVRGVPPGTRLTVQSSVGAAAWRSFPLRPVVDTEGRFRTFVELGIAGVHRLRVLEPTSGTTSDVVVVRVR